jgi:O-antigen/teichoic acid export membrane protein
MSSATGSKKRTLVNFLSLSILQVGNYVLPMITLPIISRIIGPEKYGAVNYAFAFVGYFILFINAGFDLYGTRKIISYKGDKQKIQELFSRITFSKLYISVVSTIIFIGCLFWFDQLRDEKLVNIFTYLMCIGWVLNPSWLYNGMQDSRRYAVFSFISKLLFSVAVVLVVRERSDYIYHPLITSLAHILVSLISFSWALKKYGLRFQFTGWKDVKQTLKENRTLSLIWWISNQASSTGIIVAGFLLMATDIGYYSAALRLIIIIQSIVSMPLNTVLFPYIGEAFGQGYASGIKRVHKTFPYLIFLAIAMAAGTFIIAKPLILLFFGNEFSGAIDLLKISAIALLFSTVNSALGQQIMLNLKKDAVHIKFLLAGFFLNVLFLILFINLYGTIGAAIAWPASEIFLFIGYMIYFKTQKVQVFDYSYYKPSHIFSNAMKMVRSNPLRRKTAIQ